MPIDCSKVFGVPKGTIISITGKPKIGASRVAALNKWANGYDGIKFLDLKQGESLKPDATHCRFETAEFFKPECFVKTFTDQLSELTIALRQGNGNTKLVTQTVAAHA